MIGVNQHVLVSPVTETIGLFAQIPLLMPPYGEKFEGGYIVEKNPITGGSRLIYPPKGESLMTEV